jgi:hypothetical protein
MTKRAAPKRKVLRRNIRRPERSLAPDEVDRFLLWLTAMGDLHLATRAQIRA